ncbi:hypothetical protein JOF53_000874 [Crossiella equi]|uniref:Uncharacterized protein n=1 Tax=Crossiella equi TaxID=130796 RepID=A0ABS5A6W2_9PSEU|nr:hypothetical protein [Crossiella equi]MBP2472002.1 hypothetical protein [Crossiella equi]
MSYEQESNIPETAGTGMTEVERRGYEREFRKQGLPLLVRTRDSVGKLLLRATPAVALLLVYDLVATQLEVFYPDDEAFEAFLDHPGATELYLANLLCLYLLPVLAAWLTLRWSRDHPATPDAVLLAVFLCLGEAFLAPLLDYAAELNTGTLTQVVVNSVWVLAAVLLGALGVGAVFVWSLRVALRQLLALGLLLSRALPLLLLFVTFCFYNAEIWQITSTLPRAVLWWVVALFGAVALAFLVAVARDELRELAPGEEVIPLHRREKLNLVAVLVTAQALQAAVFGLLAFCYFLLLGQLSIREEVVRQWISRGPTPGKLWDVAMPFSNELLQASLFLAVFSALYFTTSAFTDAKYRDAFFDPVVAQLRVSLAARQEYLTRWPVAG